MKKTLLCFLFLFTTSFYAQLNYVTVCSGESFDLTSQNSVFIGSLDPATPVTYFLTLNDALNNTNEIPNSTSYNGPVGTNKIYGRLNNNGTYIINYFNLTVYQRVTATASHLPISCKGDLSTLTVNAFPGATYYYSLNGGAFTTNKIFHNLPAGVYNIRVQSPNPICPDATLSYTITEPTAITAFSTTSGQTVTVTAAGGTAPYTYSKDGTTYQSSTIFTGLAPGSYTIRVRDSKGCSYVMPVITITVPGALAATATITKQLDCISGATIVANATGGQAPYSYSINGGSTYQSSNTFANILTGTFSIRVKDAVNTISVSNSVTVTPPTAINANTFVTLPDCNNNYATIMVTATGGQAPYAYSRDNGATYAASNVFTNVFPGTYRIIVKDSKGCLSPYLNTIIQPYSPLVIAASSTLISCNAGVSSLTINATGGKLPYQYSINNGTSYSTSNTYSSLNAGTYTIKVKDAVGCVSTIEHVINQPTSLIATISTAGPKITVTASGGTAPYQYSLDGASFQSSNVLTALTSGNYLVQVRDSQGCSKTFATAIVVPDPLTSSTVITKELDCNSGASIIVNATGGQSPYFYSINGGISYQTTNIFTDIPAGTYTVTVKDIANTFSNSNSIIINNPSPVTATTLVTATDCTNKATIRVQAIGGQAPYVYSLDSGTYTSANTFNNVSPGTHTISVRDSKNCLSSVVITTVQPLVPLVITASNTPVLCNGGAASLTINATGGQPPYEYSINNVIYTAGNTFTELYAGPYTVKVRDALGCSSELNYVITEPTALTATTNIEAQTVTVIGQGGTIPYQYSADGVNFQPGNIFINLSPGLHHFFVKDGNGCESTPLNVTIENPNPLIVTATNTQLDCINNATITVNAAGGQAPYHYSIDGGATYETENDFNNLIAGTYIIAVKDATNTIANTIIVIHPFVPVTATTVATLTDCNVNNATITVEATGGQAPYIYSIDGGVTYGPSNIFTNAFPRTYDVSVKDSNGCTSPIIPTIVQTPTPLVVIASHTPISCNGGTSLMTINAIGGQGPYQYSINNGAYNFSNTFPALNAGTYTIKVKDAIGCSVENEYVIAQPTALTANTNVEGQTVTINAQGGTAPYEYSLDQINFQSNNIFTNLSPGQHPIFVKDVNGCESTALNVTIADPTPLTSTAAITKPLNCGVKATITVTATGGTAPYQYSIDGGITYKSSNVFTTLNAGTYNAVVKDAINTISNTTTLVINPLIPLVLDVAITKPLDCTGTATVKATVTGGVAPYLYSIDSGSYSPVNTFNLYAARTYIVNILDNAGCIVTKPITIAPYVPTIISTVVTNVSCNGNNNGLIRVTASSGMAPFTYSIGGGYQTNNIFSNLAPGNYTVSVKDSQGCIVTKPAVITQPTALVSNINITNATCFGSATGTITVNASGGTVPYSYSVNGIDYFTNKTFNNLSAGVYNVSVKDSKGCTMSFYTTISQPEPLTINLTKSDINCNGYQDGEIIAIVTGGTAPYTYSIGNGYTSSNIFSDLATGEYNVTVKDFGGCTSTSIITILQPALSASISVINPTSSNNSDGRITINATGGTAPYVYALKNTSGITVIPAQTFNVISNLPAGSYVAQVTDARGCTFFHPGINVVAPPALVATTSAIPLTCNFNGRITVTAMGGTAPYQYSFDNGITYTSSNVFNTATPGSYVIKVRDYQYNTTSLVAVIDPVNPLQLMAMIMSPVTCSQNGTVTATVNGGRAPFVYSLNGGPFQSSNTFNVPAGIHTIVVRDSNDCTAISAIDMTAPQPVVASLIVEDQTVTITTTGGSGNYRYAISPNLNVFTTSNTFTNLEAGDYTAIVQDLNGCYVALNFEINPPAPLIEGKDAITVDFKPGQTLADLVVEGENIQWYSTPNPSETKTSKTNETPLPLTTVLVDGKTYYASQTINGVESKDRLAVTAKLNGTLSTVDFVLPNFKFYPNPVLHNLTISNTSEIDEVEIYSPSGTTVLSKKINSDHAEIDLSNVSTGVYVLKVKSEGKTKTIKILKK